MKLDLDALLCLAGKPPLLAAGEALFWDHPHISAQMLAAHLDPNTDAASRRPEVIDRTVEWLVRHLGLREGDAVLDLGCGPGLYCTRLARRGLRVTGVDTSRRSLAYAERQARDQGLQIEYVYRDYRTLEYAGRFDAALLIWCDLGVLADADRDEVLRRVHRALKPGGAFVFDVATPHWPAEPDGTTHWSVQPSGFWRPRPYLELTQTFRYPEAHLKQTIIVDEGGEPAVYRLWDRLYSPESITRALEAQGFRVEGIWADLTGEAYHEGSPLLGVVARKGSR